VVTAFPKRKSSLLWISLTILLKKIHVGEWLSSLFLVKDVSQTPPLAQSKKGKLIAMPPMVFRAKKRIPSAAEQSCDEAILRTL